MKTKSRMTVTEKFIGQYTTKIFFSLSLCFFFFFFLNNISILHSKINCIMCPEKVSFSYKYAGSHEANSFVSNKCHSQKYPNMTF